MSARQPPARSATGSPAPKVSTALRQQLLDLLSPVVAAAGYEVDDLAVSAVGRRTLLRLSVDGDGGVDLDAVAEITRAVSAALDEADPLDSPFVLEVSSPGVDRPLTEARHWRRSIGRLVRTTADGAEFTGRVRSVSGPSADGAAVEFDVDGQARTVAMHQLGAGHVEVEFRHAEEPAEEGTH